MTLAWAHNPAAILGCLLCLFLLAWWTWNHVQDTRPWLCPDCGGDYIKGGCTCEL